ncbi:nucleotidyltransferase domain-containing protein [Candidatus Woesearchaeota archaeon]|nr:nucleotidyltransferase domain-containing protein [Candidatus Woesearchaeota archaeon]
MGKEKEAIIQALKRFKRLSHVDKMIFFGSRTTETYKPDSDIDLIIVSKRYGILIIL